MFRADGPLPFPKKTAIWASSDPGSQMPFHWSRGGARHGLVAGGWGILALEKARAVGVGERSPARGNTICWRGRRGQKKDWLSPRDRRFAAGFLFSFFFSATAKAPQCINIKPSRPSSVNLLRKMSHPYRAIFSFHFQLVWKDNIASANALEKKTPFWYERNGGK